MSRLTNPTPTKWLTCVLLLLVALGMCSGCSNANVTHLKRNPWVVGTPQTLDMKFWTFTYTTMPLTSQFGVRGTAVPNEKVIPAWAQWVDELWLAAYLCDSMGRVIAQDLRIFLPTQLNRNAGIPFEFILEPEELGETGPLYVTFGYRMMLSDGTTRTARLHSYEPDPPVKPGKEPQIFFANEGALKRI